MPGDGGEVQVAMDRGRRRRLAHTRQITSVVFERDDGQWEVEATLVDSKPFTVKLPESEIAPNEPIHEMTVGITFDRSLFIRSAEARMVHTPYRVCSGISDRYRQLVGLQIVPGFNNRVKRMFHGVEGCTHLTELLATIATVALQVMRFTDNREGLKVIDGCHTFRRDGDVVRIHFPESYRPAPDRK
jgi:hypothetical protein